jgi:hypothetical protein
MWRDRDVLSSACRSRIIAMNRCPRSAKLQNTSKLAQASTLGSSQATFFKLLESLFECILDPGIRWRRGRFS